MKAVEGEGSVFRKVSFERVTPEVTDEERLALFRRAIKLGVRASFIAREGGLASYGSGEKLFGDQKEPEMFENMSQPEQSAVVAIALSSLSGMTGAVLDKIKIGEQYYEYVGDGKWADKGVAWSRALAFFANAKIAIETIRLGRDGQEGFSRHIEELAKDFYECNAIYPESGTMFRSWVDTLVEDYRFEDEHKAALAAD